MHPYKKIKAFNNFMSFANLNYVIELKIKRNINQVLFWLD